MWTLLDSPRGSRTLVLPNLFDRLPRHASHDIFKLLKTDYGWRTDLQLFRDVASAKYAGSRLLQGLVIAQKLIPKLLKEFLAVPLAHSL